MPDISPAARRHSHIPHAGKTYHPYGSTIFPDTEGFAGVFLIRQITGQGLRLFLGQISAGEGKQRRHPLPVATVGFPMINQ